MKNYMTLDEYKDFLDEYSVYAVRIPVQEDIEFEYNIFKQMFRFVIRWNSFAESSLRTIYNSGINDWRESKISAYNEKVSNLNTSGNSGAWPPGCWYMDIYPSFGRDSDGNDKALVSGIALVAGSNLIGEYEYIFQNFMVNRGDSYVAGLYALGSDVITPPIESPDYNGNGYLYFIDNKTLDFANNIELVG